MVKCLICGVEKECSIVEHLKHTHQISSKNYKQMFVGSKVKSDEELLKISERAKKNWSDPNYKELQIKKRKVTHQDPTFKKKMSDIIKKKHLENPELFTGMTQYHKTEKFKEWVVSKERIDKISKTSKKRWENNEYRQKTVNSIKKTLNDGRCQKSTEFREKMSIVISNLYSDGSLCNNSNKYKTGKYISKTNETFFYSSSYELDAMRLFDDSNCIKNWTNKHGIRVKYYFNDLNRHYIPDFLIEFNNGNSYIVEMKGWNTDEVNVKEFYTKKKHTNYKIFYNINDLTKFIDENN